MAAVAALGWLTSCAPSAEVADKPDAKPMTEHEKTFDPGDYRPEPAEERKPAAPAEKVEEEPRPQWVERKQKAMGYRIQLHSTTSIDEAQDRVAAYQRRLDSLRIHSGRLDMTFDAPYYKVRMGDFLSKPPADSLRSLLNEQGVPEAWVVRDKVIQIIRERKQ